MGVDRRMHVEIASSMSSREGPNVSACQHESTSIGNSSQT
jgi:hypothetical protein